MMSESNTLETIVLADEPNTRSNEQIFVYVPIATNTTPGLVKFDSYDFRVAGGKVYLNEIYLDKRIDDSVEQKVNSIGLEMDDSGKIAIPTATYSEKGVSYYNKDHFRLSVDGQVSILEENIISLMKRNVKTIQNASMIGLGNVNMIEYATYSDDTPSDDLLEGGIYLSKK